MRCETASPEKHKLVVIEKLLVVQATVFLCREMTNCHVRVYRMQNVHGRKMRSTLLTAARLKSGIQRRVTNCNADTTRPWRSEHPHQLRRPNAERRIISR